MGINNNAHQGTRALGECGLGMKGTVHSINREGASCSLIGAFWKTRCIPLQRVFLCNLIARHL